MCCEGGEAEIVVGVEEAVYDILIDCAPRPYFAVVIFRLVVGCAVAHGIIDQETARSNIARDGCASVIIFICGYEAQACNLIDVEADAEF
jgi:hypothetical protein